MGHILIIDREISSTHALTEALSHADFRTTVLSNGQEAVEWARAHRPEAIILSVELTGVSGYAICNRLKKDEALRDIPLLLSSSEASEEVFAEHKRLRTRADGYLFKPYDTATVLHELHQLQHAHITTAAHNAQEPAVAAPTDRGPAHAAPVARQAFADDDDRVGDPLMSTDALLLLEGSVDVNKHTQVIRLPMSAKGDQAKDLIGAALADMDSNAMAALTAMEGRVQAFEDALQSQASQLADQQALLTQLTDALARNESKQKEFAATLAQALQGSLQLCLNAIAEK